MDKRGGIKIFRRNVLISQCRKLSQGNPFVMCFIKLPLAEKIMDKRGGIKTFRRRIFVSQCRKPSQLNAFVLRLRKLPVAKKTMEQRGAGYQDFPSKKNCLTMPKIFAKEPFVLCFRKLPLAEKIMDKRGGIKTFRRTFFCPRVLKNP